MKLLNALFMMTVLMSLSAQAKVNYLCLGESKLSNGIWLPLSVAPRVELDLDIFTSQGSIISLHDLAQQGVSHAKHLEKYPIGQTRIVTDQGETYLAVSAVKNLPGAFYTLLIPKGLSTRTSSGKDLNFSTVLARNRFGEAKYKVNCQTLR